MKEKGSCLASLSLCGVCSADAEAAIKHTRKLDLEVMWFTTLFLNRA